MIHEVRVFDAKNKLKKVISTKVLVKRLYAGCALPLSMKRGKPSPPVKPKPKKRVKAKKLLPKENCAHLPCKKEFQPTRKGHIFCNDPCTRSLINRQARAKKVHKCKRCEEEFSNVYRNKIIFCHDPCTWAMYKEERDKAKRNNQHKDQECMVCHKLFDSTRKRRVCLDPCTMNSKLHRKLTKGDK